jgi:hypothetical protein
MIRSQVELGSPAAPSKRRGYRHLRSHSEGRPAHRPADRRSDTPGGVPSVPAR